MLSGHKIVNKTTPRKVINAAQKRRYVKFKKTETNASFFHCFFFCTSIK